MQASLSRRQLDVGHDSSDRLVNGNLTFAKKYWAPTAPVAGQQFEYQFDDIGNRKTSGYGGDELGNNLRYSTYWNNSRNQSLSNSVPGYIEVTGLYSPSSAIVTVNGQAAYRKTNSQYFWKELSTNNVAGSADLWITNKVGTNILDLRHVFVPQTPQSNTYDLSGNLTSDARWTNQWDAENRLVSMESMPGVPTDLKRKLQFAYDAMGRRIQKIVYTDTGSGYVGQYTNKFVYDGWNLIAILKEDNRLLQSFTWGSDLSGTMQGAGGIGGLLMMTDYTGISPTNYYYCCDGKGNVAVIINPTKTGANYNVASYECNAFGEVIKAMGPVATNHLNPFIFSTKYYDWETGLYYYGHRYYNPSTGRWLSPDPLGEAGGVNLYGFVGNDPVNFYDKDGQKIEPMFIGPIGLGKDPLRDIVNALVSPISDIMAGHAETSGNAALDAWARTKRNSGNGEMFQNLAELERFLNEKKGRNSGIHTPGNPCAIRGLKTTVKGVFDEYVQVQSAIVVPFGSGLEGGVAREIEASVAESESVGFTSFNALKNFIGSPGEGNVWHHIVEQSQIDKFGANAIHNVDNVIAISDQLNSDSMRYILR